MIKVTTSHGTVYIIDKDKEQIKRIPSPGSEVNSVLRGFIYDGTFKPYTSLKGLEIGESLYVLYPNDQLWSLSTPITEIDYEYEDRRISKNFKICDDSECNDEMEDIIQSYREENNGE